MDLTLEKADLLEFQGISHDEADRFHFEEPPALAVVSSVVRAAGRPFPLRNQANIGAVRRHRLDDAGAMLDFVSGYDSAVLPNLWDRSAEVRSALC